jgi:uncharacterized protein (TIGR03083 family)
MTYPDIRAAATAQAAVLAARVARLADADLALPTRLPPWTVRELVAHVTRTIGVVGAALAAPAPPVATVALDDYYSHAAVAADGVRDRTVEEARAAGDARWQERITTVVAEVTDALPDSDRLVTTRIGAVSLADFLVTRCVEGVVHGLDLARALGDDPEDWYEPAAAAVCAGLLARLGVAHGVTTDVRTEPVVVGRAGRAATTSLTGYVEWATGRGPAPMPWLADVSPVLR